MKQQILTQCLRSRNSISRLTAALLILLAALLPSAAVASDARLIEQLQQRLEAQEQLNQRLLERVEALEKSREELKAGLHSAEHADSTAGQEYARVEADAAEALELSQQVDRRLDNRPDLHGYFDLEYFTDDSTESQGEFRQHHLSLHINQDLARFRFFSEVEFEYAPFYGGSGGNSTPEGRGEIKVEEAWGEYFRSDLLKIRAGLIVEPGYWNVNHYPNIALSTRRPLLVRNVFPGDLVGVMGHGNRYLKNLGWSYHLLVANGQSDDYGHHDDNDSKAVGAGFRLHLRPANFDTFDIGIRGYSDQPSGGDRSNVWGIDAQIRRGPFELLTQLATREGAGERSGFYLQPGLRGSEHMTTFARYDLLDIDGGNRREEYTLGVNYRPVPQVSLKLEFYHARQSLKEEINGLAASVVMAFGAYDE